MKKKTLALTALGTCLLISSCTYDKDPFLDFKNEAKQKYVEYYQKNPGLEKAPLFYFDISTLRSALVRSEDEVSFLGQFKLTDFTFSESKNYFADVGNLPITVTDSNNDGMPDQFKVGDFVSTDENGNTAFDVKTFINNLPLVLHEVKSDNTIATYSMLSSDGTILDSSNAKAYDPDFFYISDLKLSVQGLEGFADELLDFTGKDVCVLRKDLYQVLGELTATAIPPQVENFFNVSELFNGMYSRAKGLDSFDAMPQAISIKGKHYTNFNENSAREVVVGPFSLINEIFNKFIPSETTAEVKPSLVHEIPTVYIEEGVKTVSLFAFNGERKDGASTSKIKDIYLPSTLQNVQFNAFSNLDLNSLYVNKTYKETSDGNSVEKPFDYVDFGDIKISMGEGESKLDLDVTGSFSHSTFNNLYFEGYDNQNINNFPYSSTLNLSTNDGINKALKIYSKNDGTIDVNKAKDLTEAFGKYHTVNPFYQLSLAPNQDKKYIVSSGISSIDNGKTLYLPSKIYSLSTDDSRTFYNGKVAKEATPEQALFTLKLDKDLTIKKNGTLIIGSNIAATDNQSGVNAGEFSAIDLNGHKLIVEDGGSLFANGFIYDSSTSSGGKIELLKGSKFTTNVTINNYQNLNHVMENIDNGVAPFDSYSFNSLLADAYIEQGATVFGNLDYIDNGFANNNVITLISGSNKALFQLTSGKLVLNKSKISSLDDSTNVILNNADLIEITDNTSAVTNNEKYGTKDFPFALANKTFSVELANLTNATKIYVDENSAFNVKNLTLEEGSLLLGLNNNKLQISNDIKVKEGTTKFTLSGEFKLNDSTYSSFKKLLQENDGSLISNYTHNFISKNNEHANYSKIGYNLSGYVGDSISNYKRKLFKNTSGYYYAYENNGEAGKLLNSVGSELATYSKGQSTWFNGTVDTKVSSQSLISSYKEIDKLHVLENVNNKVIWVEKKLSPLTNGTYDVDGKSFIKPFKTDEFIEGQFVKDTPLNETIFETKIAKKKYVYTPVSLTSKEKSWVEINDFDNYSTLQIVDKNISLDLKYIALVEGEYKLGFDYDSLKHIASKNTNGVLKQYAYTNENRYEEFNPNALKWEDKQINDINDKLIYLSDNGKWAKVDELHKGLCKYLMPNGNFYYYFLINNKWYQSVEGEIAKSYNSLADMSFGVIKDKITYHGAKYKFVMRNGDNPDTPFELFMPEELIKVTKKDFPDLWPENAATEYLYAFRHIIKNDGSKWLFFKDETTNKVSLKKFEFAPGFTPSYPDGTNTNVLTKFNFIMYKVIFEGETTPRTLYVVTDASDKNNAIYAGNTNISDTGELTDEYLAIAIFTTNNPINDFINGEMPNIPVK